MLSIKEINKAYDSIKSFIVKTPLVTNENFNSLFGAKIYFKLENLQQTGSFKIRGASYKVLLLTNNQKKNGVVAYSSGNHAQAVAFATLKYGIDSLIVMPDNAPKIKIKNTKKYGAKIILYDSKKEIREEIGRKIERSSGRTLIKPYDDLNVITGQGTVGKEISEQLKELNITPDLYLCCCGGGGLIAGSSFYLKDKYPQLKVYSVEPIEFNDTFLSLKKNRIISNKNTANSICDALLASCPGKLTFDINKQILAGGLSVSDADVKKAIKIIAETLKLIVEPGGAAAVAALLANKVKVKNKTVVVMLSGGNIDADLFSKILTTNYE